MQLKYSIPNKVPFIEFEDGSRLVFSTLLENKEKGFNYMTFSGRSMSSVCISGKGARKKKFYDTSEVISFATDMNLNNLDKRIKTKAGPLSPITLGILKKLFGELAPRGWMSRKSLVKLDKVLTMLNNDEEDKCDDDPTANGDEWE